MLQLGSLMRTIRSTRVHYVRCIKPNRAKSSSTFDRLLAAEQLRCAGVVEAIRISRSGYPQRMAHAEFAARGRKRARQREKEKRACASSFLMTVQFLHI